MPIDQGGIKGMESDNMKEFIINLPKAELHLHIEGTLSPHTIIKLAARNNIDLPWRSVEAINSALANKEPGLVGFLDHHYLVVSIMQTQADFYEVTYELLRTCKEDNMVYVESFFDPQFHTARGISFEAMINGIDRGR
jgi:adenosine deaminase